MDRPEVIDALNRLLQILSRSLPAYLQYARPWARPNNEKAREALAHVVADQQKYVERIVEQIEQLGGRPEPAGFPTQFTSIHDLALDYLVRRAIEHQQRDVEAIGGCVDDLADEPGLRWLAQEVLDNQRGHLETLKALLKEP